MKMQFKGGPRDTIKMATPHVDVWPTVIECPKEADKMKMRGRYHLKRVEGDTGFYDWVSSVGTAR